MKLIDFWKSEKYSEYELNSIGVQWFSGWESPAVLNPIKEMRVYWRFCNVVFAFWKKQWTLEVRLQKMPFRNKEEYLKWRKEWLKNSREREEGMAIDLY